MNNSNPLPSQPPPLNLPPDPTPRRSPARPPGEDPAEGEAIPNAILVSETIWQPRRVMFQLRQPGAGKLIGAMLFVGLVRSLVYGVVAGTFSGSTHLWTARVKTAVGLMISALICLPSLYIFTCLGGSQARLAEEGERGHGGSDCA